MHRIANSHGQLQRKVEDRRGHTAGLRVGGGAGAGSWKAWNSTCRPLDFVPEALGSPREVAQMVAQKRHQTCILGGSRQLFCRGWIWLGVLEGCVEGTVDTHPDPLSWARATLSVGCRQLRVTYLFRELLSTQKEPPPLAGVKLRVTY